MQSSAGRSLDFVGRTRESGVLRGSYDRPAASLRWVVGLPGVGKTETVLRAAAPFPLLYHRVPPLSDPLQRAALAGTLRDAPAPGSAPLRLAGDPPSWEALFHAMVDSAPQNRTTVVVLDDAHRWVESRARIESPIREALARAREIGRTLHLNLLAPGLPSTRLGEVALPPLMLGPLPFRAAATLLPGATPADRMRAYAVFGGLPGVLAQVDPNATLEANLRRLVLDRDAHLREGPMALLERSFQKPARYAAILSALAGGEGDWGTVQAGVGDLTASGQAGPYLKRLEEVGLVEARRSLDASPRSRSRRYRITDPFVAFWFRFVLPHLEGLGRGGGEGACMEAVRSGLAAQVGSVLPAVCRDFMTFDAMEELGANARECGSLWGPGYDLPVAGFLTTGVPFYGQLGPGSRKEGAAWLGDLDAQVRETRYGFGRERRLRILFLGEDAPPDLLRSAARRDNVVLLALDNLAG